MTTLLAIMFLVSGLSMAALAAQEDAGPTKPDAELPSAELPSSPEDVDLGDASSGFIQAIQAGKWVAAVGFGLMLLGAALRRLVGFIANDWAASRKGGLAIGAGSALLIALGGGLTSGMHWLDAVLGAIGLAGTAAGIWSVMPARAKSAGRPRASSEA